MIFVWFFLLLTNGNQAYKPYQTYIPNGENVPNPCKEGMPWPGVGHINLNGADTRNEFGKDFSAAGHKWTYELCNADSDGDGKSNGLELGDPSCTWSKGQIPQRTDMITHPGICDPVESERCKLKKTSPNCTLFSGNDTCETIKKNETEVIDFRLPEWEVPNTETNYVCMKFDFPKDQNYHIKAVDAIKDNMIVLHHILIYACRNDKTTLSKEPEKCIMGGDDDCEEIIAVWGVGADRMCYEEDIGFMIGKDGIKRIKLELHWDNPLKMTGQNDSSGMRIWYQPAKPSVQDMAVFTVGQQLLQIPPRQPRVEFTANCNTNCSKDPSKVLISKPLTVKYALNHMHLLGIEMKLEVFRDGKFLRQLTNDMSWDYNKPRGKKFEDMVQIQPGDEIKTTCVYNSMKTDRWTYFGDGTNDEMCFGFLWVYPKDALPYGGFCINDGVLTNCDLWSGKPIGQCDWKTFTDFSHPEMQPIIKDLEKDCNLDGFCRPECRNTSKRLREHPCMQGDAETFTNNELSKNFEGVKFLARLNSCPKNSSLSSRTQCEQSSEVDVRDAAHGIGPAGILITVCTYAAIITFVLV